MEEALNTSVGGGGFLTALAEKVTSAEAFIIIIILIMLAFIWKFWGEFRRLMLEREKTSEERNARFQAIETKVDGHLQSHRVIHKEIDKRMDRLEKVIEDNNRDLRCIRESQIKQGAKLDVLIEKTITKPRLP